MSNISWLIVIDGFGLGMGVLSVLVILFSMGKIGGGVAKAFFFMMIGVLAQTLAFAYTLVFTRFKLFEAPSVDIHHLLMAAGLLFFVLGAKKFSDLSR